MGGSCHEREGPRQDRTLTTGPSKHTPLPLNSKPKDDILVLIPAAAAEVAIGVSTEPHLKKLVLNDGSEVRQRFLPAGVPMMRQVYVCSDLLVSTRVRGEA